MADVKRIVTEVNKEPVNMSVSVSNAAEDNNDNCMNMTDDEMIVDETDGARSLQEDNDDDKVMNDSSDKGEDEDDEADVRFTGRKKHCLMLSSDSEDGENNAASVLAEAMTVPDNISSEDENKENLQPSQDDSVDGVRSPAQSKSRSKSCLLLSDSDSDSNENRRERVPLRDLPLPEIPDETDAEIGVETPKKKSVFDNSDIFAQDESSDNDARTPVAKKKVKTKTKPSAKSGSSSGSDSDSDKSRKSDKSRRSSRSENSSGSDKQKISQPSQKSRRANSSNSDSDGSEKSKKSNRSRKSNGSRNSDQSRKSRRSNSSDSDSEKSKSDSSKSGDEERPDISKYTKKGAAKTAKKSSSGGDPKEQRQNAKQRREELNDIHSETQRLVRESEVRLPYHKPKPLDLSAILQKQKERKKTMQLRPSLAVIRQISINEEEKKRRSKIDKKFSLTDLPPIGDTSDTLTAASDKCRDWLSDKTGNDVAEETPKPEVASNPEVNSSTVNKTDIAMPSDEESLPELTVMMEKSSAKVIDPNSGFGLEKDLENNVEFSIPKGMDPDILKDDLPEMTKPKDDPEHAEEITEIPPKKLSKLASLPSDIAAFTPRLAGSDQGFIDLDTDDDDEDKMGLQLLKTRFMKQRKKVSPRQKKKVEITYVHKEKTPGGDKEELKLDSVSYVVEAEESSEVFKPGAKLLMLKEKLRSDMKKQRAEARRRKLELINLDNEEGFEEEEAELTDDSDTDQDNDDNVNEAGDQTLKEKKSQKKNNFADEEAMDDDANEPDGDADNEDNDDDDDDEEEDSECMKLQLDDEDSNVDNESQATKDSVKMRKKSTRSDSDDDQPGTLSSSLNLSTQDMFTPFARSSSNKRTHSDKLYGQGHLALPIDDTHYLLKLDDIDDVTTPSKLHESSLDDTQSLLLDEHGFLKSTCSITYKQPFPAKKPEKLSLVLDDSGSQHNMNELLGLCSGNFTETQATQQKDSVKSLFNATQGSNQDDMSELLGLCSGSFAATQTQKPSTQKKKNTTLKSLFNSTQNSSSLDKMGDLLGLCSGTFTTPEPSTLKRRNSQLPMDEDAQHGTPDVQHGTPDDVIRTMDSGENLDNNDTEDSRKGKMDSGDTRKRKFGKYPEDADSDDEDMGLRLLSDNEDDNDDNDDETSLPALKKKKTSSRVFSDDEAELSDDNSAANDKDSANEESADEDGDEVEQEDEDSDELASDDERLLVLDGVQSKKGKVRSSVFFEQEAELSGSEAGSDENEDLDDSHDVLEQELGDQDDVGTEDQLRSQVGKVHLKSMMDQDKKDLRLFQEMYLADGDLHSDNGGRNRKFRWRNIDDDMDDGTTARGADSDCENVLDDDENEAELKRRKERFERERWLEEQKASQEDDDQEEAESQLMKLGRVVLKRQNSALSNNSQKNTDVPKQPGPVPMTPPSILKAGHQKHGSFLNRGKGQLAKIAELTKPASNATGTTNSRNFVFSALSPGDREKKRKQHEQVPVSASPNQAKRAKVEKKTTNKQKNSGTSIFKLMN